MPQAKQMWAGVRGAPKQPAWKIPDVMRVKERKVRMSGRKRKSNKWTFSEAPHEDARQYRQGKRSGRASSKRSKFPYGLNVFGSSSYGI